MTNIASVSTHKQIIVVSVHELVYVHTFLLSFNITDMHVSLLRLQFNIFAQPIFIYVCVGQIAGV